MLPQYAKNGYAYEAAKNYLVELNKNKVGKIIAIVKPDNANSIQLLNKLGLLFEETFNDKNEILARYTTIIC